MQDVRAFRGADAASDHHLVVSKIRLKLRKAAEPAKVKCRKFDVAKLANQQTKRDFVLELSNRFDALRNLDGSEEEDEDNSVQAAWDQIKTILTESAEKVLGFVKKSRKAWITDRTWNKIEERRRMKEKVNQSHSERIKQIRRRQYADKNKEVKACAREDKEKFIEDRAKEAEEAAAKGEMNTVYKITKELSSKKPTIVPVKDKVGRVITNEREQAERWKSHFKEVLNLP